MGIMVSGVGRCAYERAHRITHNSDLTRYAHEFESKVAVWMSWAAAEFAGLDLGDERLNRRAVKLAETFSRQLMASIPSACGGWAEAKAAYRFFGSDSGDWQDILQPHWQSSRLRMAAPPVVLCLQDTTELDVNGQGITGLGRQSDAAQRGIYLHPTCAVTPDREPLGVSDAWMWARAEKGVPAPLESARWTEGHERIAEQAGHPPQTRLVYVAEREGAILGLVQRAQALNHPADWLIRSQHDRTLPGGGKLWDTVIAGGPLRTIRFTQPARPGHPARAVRRAVYACRIELAGGVDVTGVVAWELSAPGGVKPIEWRLLSHRACIDFEFAVQLIDWYRVRWDNEWLFHLIKIACASKPCS